MELVKPQKLMDEEGVLRLFDYLTVENRNNFESPSGLRVHLKCSYEIAGNIAEDILRKYDFVRNRLNPGEVALAAGFHDIGRVFQKNQVFHELRGARYVEENGLEKGVADNLVDVYRIAQMFRPHYLVFEQFTDEQNREQAEEFRDIDLSLLIPRTWQEKIVVYADLSNLDGGVVHFEERIRYIEKMYKPGTRRAYSNPTLMRAMKRGLPRIIAICRKVESAARGKLAKQKISREGFI